MTPTRTHRDPGSCAVVLFHSVLGVRPAVRDWAARLERAGYTVHVPDLFDGATFDHYADGTRHVESIGGIPELIARSQRAVADLPPALVYAGFSAGAAAAELLALTRPGARGAILMHGVLPLEAFHSSEWPAPVPVQLHQAVEDPFRSEPAIEAFTASVRRSHATLERWDYPGAGHLFADAELPDYDATSATQMLERVLDGLSRMCAA